MGKLKANLLDDLTIKAAKPKDKPYTLRDGNCLFLLVHSNGSKYFQVRTTLHGKTKKIQLGSYPLISLSKARELARESLQLVKTEKRDPVLEKKLQKNGRAKDAENTFQKIAEEWLEIKSRSLAQSTHLKIQQTFKANVYGVIGKYPIKEINNIMVRNCLLIMDKRGATEYMEKTRGWIKAVFDFAFSDNLVSENPIPVKDERLSKHLSQKFPHLKSLDDAQKLIRMLNDYPGGFEVKACVYLLMHTAQRPSELREAKWCEFDLDNCVWTIPLERSKTKKHMTVPHTVMLSNQAINMLKELQFYTGHQEYLFSSRRKHGPISEGTLRKAFRTLFTDYHVVPHGCRHLFSTQANESKLFDKDVIEVFISHNGEDRIRKIYNEATYDSHRRKLAQWWSDQLDTLIAKK